MAGVLNNANNWGNVVFGVSNTATGSYSTVLGGQGNVASGDTVVVLGGYFNLASGYVSCISGGGYNNAIGNGSSVSGGLGNTAGFMPDGDWSTVSGGRGVIEEAWSGWAAGGFNNTDIFTRPDRAQSGPGTFSFPLP